MAVEIFINEFIKKDNKKSLGHIYTQIANRFRTTYLRVERAIRNEHTKNEELIKSFFKVNYKITNSNFIALLAREVLRKN